MIGALCWPNYTLDVIKKRIKKMSPSGSRTRLEASRANHWTTAVTKEKLQKLYINIGARTAVHPYGFQEIDPAVSG